MKLPHPRPSGFTHPEEVERNRQIELADRQNHKRGQDVEVEPGRLILTSPDGTRWNVTVDNAGTISATSL